MENVLYTIGYATKKIDDFIGLLKLHDINCLVDVRTSPYSKTFSEYNKETLSKVLAQNNINYLHFGNEFGARRSEDSSYEYIYELKGEEHRRIEQVSFDKVYKNNNFLNGVKRIEDGISKGYKICFMCSEKYPINCHRFWMVAYYFAVINEKHFKIVNIIENDKDVNFELSNTKEIESLLRNKSIYKGDIDYSDVKELISAYPEYSMAGSLLEEYREPPKWYLWWDKFNQMPKSLSKLHLYNNILIGYKKGENDAECIWVD